MGRVYTSTLASCARSTHASRSTARTANAATSATDRGRLCPVLVLHHGGPRESHQHAGGRGSRIRRRHGALAAPAGQAHGRPRLVRGRVAPGLSCSPPSLSPSCSPTPPLSET